MTSQATPPPHPPAPAGLRKDRLLLVLVLAVGVGLSALLGNALQQTEDLRERDMRAAAAASVRDVFDLDLVRTVEAVRNTALMIESHPELSREQFSQYAEKILSQLRCINIVEWQPIVPARELDAFEARARRNGMPQFRVVQPNAAGTAFEPVSGRSEYVPVLYAWPERFRTEGYDMSFSPERMESKLRSRITGHPVASGVFSIMKEGAVSADRGIAISTTVYQERWKALGYLAAVVDLNTLFLEASQRANAAQLDMLVYDNAQPQAPPIYTRLGTDTDLAADRLTRSASSHDLVSGIDIAGQDWDIVLHPRPAFLAEMPIRYSRIMLIAGLFTTLLLVTTTARAQANRRGLEQAQVVASNAHRLLATEREHILELNETLERRVMERTAALTAVQLKLQRSQDELTHSAGRATLGTLAASVSHELGSPLGNSLLTASTLSSDALSFEQLAKSKDLRRSDLDAFVSRMVDGNVLVLRNLQRAVELVKKFRQVAADQASEQRRSFGLRQVLQEVLDTIAPTLQRKPHRVVLDVPDDIVLDSYPGPLGQVTINLINNAYLHAFEGMAQGLVTVQGRAADDGVTLTFTDNGCGMNAQNLEKIFEPFFSTRIGSGGTGLGMAIVNSLVTSTLGGSLQVQSAPGQGTQIKIHLPWKAQQPSDSRFGALTDSPPHG